MRSLAPPFALALAVAVAAAGCGGGQGEPVVAVRSPSAAPPAPAPADSLMSSITALPNLAAAPFVTQHRLYIDVRRRGAWTGAWRMGRTVLAMFDVPQERAALVDKLSSEWLRYHEHFEEADPKTDVAVVLVDEATPEDDVRLAVGALRERTRKRQGADVPVFEVAIARFNDPELQPHWRPPRDAGDYAGPPPHVDTQVTSVSGRLDREDIHRVLDEDVSRVEQCYRAGLRASPELAGEVKVRFVIGNDGVPTNPSGSSILPDAALVECIAGSIVELRFPRPRGGIVTVDATIALRP